MFDSPPQRTDSCRRASRFQTAASVALSFVAATVLWGIVQAKQPFFSVHEKYSIGMNAPAEARSALLAQMDRVLRLNSATIFGIGGSLLAGALAIVANSCCGVGSRAIVGLFWGAIAGAGTGFLSAVAFRAIMPKTTLPSVTDSGSAQALAFGLLGAVVGLMYGGMTSSAKKSALAVVGGAIGGGAGGMAYPILAGILLPNVSTTAFIPTDGMVRWLWITLPFVAIGMAIPSLANQPTDKLPSNLGAESSESSAI